jgi:tRNA uridine 5-carboxymethylaminomethyl modification enzyme
VRDALSQQSSAADLRGRRLPWFARTAFAATLASGLRFRGIDADTLRRAARSVAGKPSASWTSWVTGRTERAYLERQDAEIARLHSDDAIALPGPFSPTAAVPGLSNEMVEAPVPPLAPAALGAASRIRGVTPAALAAIPRPTSVGVAPHEHRSRGEGVAGGRAECFT